MVSRQDLPRIHAIILGEALPDGAALSDRAFERVFPDGRAVARMLGLPPGLHARQGEWLLNMWENNKDPMTPLAFQQREHDVVAGFQAMLNDPARSLCKLKGRGATVNVLCTTRRVRRYLAAALSIAEEAIPEVLDGAPYEHHWAEGGRWRIALIKRNYIRYSNAEAASAARVFIGRRE